MRTLWEPISSFIILFFLFTAPSTAEIKSIKIQSDNRPTILFEKFGFIDTGRVAVSVSNVSVISKTESPPNRADQGFFLVSEESMIQVLHELQQNPGFCVMYSKYISLLFTFLDLSPQLSFNHSFSVTNPSEYSLFFANCQHESLVTMDVQVELFNEQGATSSLNYS